MIARFTASLAHSSLLRPTMPRNLQSSVLLASSLAIATNTSSTLDGVNGFVISGRVSPCDSSGRKQSHSSWPSRGFSTATELHSAPDSLGMRSSTRDGRPNPLPSPSEFVGVIFDMDGTITKHCIDFADLRRRIYDIADDDFGGPDKHDGGCVLELAEKLSPDGRKRANDVFQDIEQKAIDDMKFMDGLVDLCRCIDDLGVKRAILTRNVRRSVDALHDRLLDDEGISGFYPALARDSTCEQGNLIPAKPAPDAILHICNVWGCDPSNVIMVGDSPADDIVAGSRAGCRARILLAEGGVVRDNDSGNGGPIDEEEARQRTPCITVASLLELRDLLRDNQ